MTKSLPATLLLATLLSSPAFAFDGPGSFVYRVYSPGMLATQSNPGAPDEPSVPDVPELPEPTPSSDQVLLLGTYANIHVNNFTLGQILREGSDFYVNTGGNASFAIARLDGTSLQTIGLTGNWSAFGLPAGTANIHHVFPHPTDSSLKVFVGEWSASSGSNSLLTAIAQLDGTVLATSLGPTGATTYAAMHGSTVYLNATNGSAAETCTVQATTLNCTNSVYGGLSLTTDNLGKLHVLSAGKVGVFEQGPFQPLVRYAVIGLPGSMRSLAFGSDGNLYATVIQNPGIWKIDRSTWQASLYAGSDTETGVAAGDTTTARFSSNVLVQKSPTGLYVKDTGSRRIYEIKF